MIKTTDLVKDFDGYRALDGLNLHVSRGSVYGLVGPNGAGKSTAIRIITGVFRQSSGIVEVDSQSVYENPEIKEKIAYIPDDVFSYGQATVREMMRLTKGVYRSFDMQRFDALEELFSDINTDVSMQRLSKGMQKQAAFWIAASRHPEILVLDEPMDGLDPITRKKIWSLILEDVTGSGLTVLVSSHNLRELEDVCDCVGIMDSGRMKSESRLSELQDRVVKIQTALPDGVELPDGLDIVHSRREGKLRQLVLRGNAEELRDRIAAVGPLFLEVLPLNLEEIYIYELGGSVDEKTGSVI